MDLMHTASRYLLHKLTGNTPHGVHSPFVYEFYNKVILDETPYYFHEHIESIRSSLLLNDHVIEVKDFGTGGEKESARRLKISYIAGHFLQSKKNARLLSRIVIHSGARNILELGTSLGITSMYLALADKKNRLLTLEGCENTATLAKENFAQLSADNIELITGEFDSSLPEALRRLDKIDLAYFDGNHTRPATLRYFEACLEKAHEKSIFIFDDIHWSKEMSHAWHSIRNHSQCTLSIDLFHLGIVFFREGIPKQHFRLKF